ncbi:MAG: glycosyltransferase [Thermoplasmata archaeon]
MNRLVNYREFVSESQIASIYRKATKLCDKHIVHINSTYTGGGVAEMLRSSIPLMNETGIDAGWRMVVGFKDYYKVTKKLHNTLQGEDINFTSWNKKLYEETNKKFSSFTHLDHDLVIIHDPQPLPLIQYSSKTQPWLWRCHIDLSNPDKDVWDYLKNYVLKYDATIYQLEQFKMEGGNEYEYVLRPAIDPLTIKNKDLEEKKVVERLKDVGIDTERPFIAQVSRFDKWKDPLGVIKIFKIIKEMGIDCQLVLVGGMATDDPEGEIIYRQLREEIKEMEDVILLLDAPDILVNAVQSKAEVILQMSIKEGFGLTVTEALWKRTPVVSTKVGGIPQQIDHGKNGYLVEPGDYTDAAKRTADLLQDDGKRREMGIAGRQKVKENFLIPRLVEDWIDILTDQLC